MKTIITIQHPESEHHVNGMIGSQTDWGLTENGKQHAKRIATSISQALEGATVSLYASDQRRVVEGAELLASKLNVTPIYDARLREQHLGVAIGKSVAWLKSQPLETVVKADTRLVLGAESLRDVYRRLKPLYETFKQDDASHIIVYGHGASLSVLHLIHLQLDEDALNTIRIHGKAGAIAWMRILDDGRHTLDQFSTHLS